MNDRARRFVDDFEFEIEEAEPRTAEFDENQPRDERGRWTDGDTSGESGGGETVKLYRGDSQSLNPSLSYSDPRALFGAGIYLTDSKRIAGDYRSKGARFDDGVVWRYGGNAKTTKQDAIDAYIRREARYVDVEGNKLEFEQRLHGYTYEPGVDVSAEWKRMADEDTTRVEHARKAWESSKNQYEVRKQADNTIIIRNKTDAGHVSHYDIPQAWVSKTLDAEDEISEPVAAALHSTLSRLDDRGTAEDLYRFATRKDEDGFRPSFRDVFTSIVGGPLRSEEGSVALRKMFKELGYKGIRYSGGQTMGGARHNAYVFWDEQGLKKSRTLEFNENQPRDERGRWTSGIPPEPGTTPIPPGMIRGYHYTNQGPEALQNILREGLLKSRARGDTYGEPNVIWMSTDKPGDFKHFVEVLVTPEELKSAGLGGPHSHIQQPDGSWKRAETPEELQQAIDIFNKGSHNFATDVARIPPSRIVTYSEPWIAQYHHVANDPSLGYQKMRAGIVAGEHDAYAGAKGGDTARAIEAIKANFDAEGNLKKSVRTAAQYRPETLVHRAADKHAPKIEVAVRYAFAVGRKAVDREALRAALAEMRAAESVFRILYYDEDDHPRGPDGKWISADTTGRSDRRVKLNGKTVIIPKEVPDHLHDLYLKARALGITTDVRVGSNEGEQGWYDAANKWRGRDSVRIVLDRRNDSAFAVMHKEDTGEDWKPDLLNERATFAHEIGHALYDRDVRNVPRNAEYDDKLFDKLPSSVQAVLRQTRELDKKTIHGFTTDRYSREFQAWRYAIGLDPEAITRANVDDALKTYAEGLALPQKDHDRALDLLMRYRHRFTGLEGLDDSPVQAALAAVADAPDAVAAALRQVLPQTLLAALQAGGEAGVAILRRQLRAAARGNWGHAGRPGHVGGSAPSGGEGNRWQQAKAKYEAARVISAELGTKRWHAEEKVKEIQDRLFREAYPDMTETTVRLSDIVDKNPEYQQAVQKLNELTKEFNAAYFKTELARTEMDKEQRLAATPENVRKAEEEVNRLSVLLNESADKFWKMPDVRSTEYNAKEFQAAKAKVEQIETKYKNAQKALEKAHSDNRIERVTRRTQDIAAQMNYDPSKIDVIDAPPRSFDVGNVSFQEAGHFNPVTGRIQINARNTAGDTITSTTGVVAHEIAHAQYDEIIKIQEREHREIVKLMNTAVKEFTNEPWTQEKILEVIPDFAQRFPVSSLFHRTLGDQLVTDKAAYVKQIDKMAKDDGVSTYSEAYWKAIDQITPGHLGPGNVGLKGDAAINETLAEVRRMLEVPWTRRSGDKTPSPEWTELAKTIGYLYAARNKVANATRA